jgi:hypothetical protein
MPAEFLYLVKWVGTLAFFAIAGDVISLDGLLP